MHRRIALYGMLIIAAGCQKTPTALAPPKPPEVIIAKAVAQDVSDFEEFTGRTEAVETVEIRAHVTGYLERVPFSEGARVKKGDLLFEIDPRLLKAEADRSAANLAQAEARVTRLEADFKRMNETPKGTLSGQEFDKVLGDLLEARAAVKSADAAHKSAQLSLQYTKVIAPINGRIGRRLLDPGNIVKADETALTYLADLDRIYVFFDVDERTYLTLSRQLIARGTAELDQIREMPVWMGLVDETGYPREGRINFVDSRVDPNTGSVWVRGIFDNSKGLLTAGLFVRVRVRVSDPHTAVLVPEPALTTDQGQKFIYVLNDKDEAIYRSIEVGAQHGQLREIRRGIEAGERVIVKGLQRVRPGVKVEPKEDDKPVAASAPGKDK
jgi:RND family efflux transporter MFP subunit